MVVHVAVWGVLVKVVVVIDPLFLVHSFPPFPRFDAHLLCFPIWPMHGLDAACSGGISDKPEGVQA